MGSRITSGLRGLEAFERDYLLFQMDKMAKSCHWNSCRCEAPGC